MDGKPAPVILALIAATDAAVAEAKEWVAAHPDGSRIERLARRFCEDDRQDPDAVTMGLERMPPCYGAKGTIGLMVPLRPQWMLYIREAVTAIKFIEEHKGGE